MFLVFVDCSRVNGRACQQGEKASFLCTISNNTSKKTRKKKGGVPIGSSTLPYPHLPFTSPQSLSSLGNFLLLLSLVQRCSSRRQMQTTNDVSFTHQCFLWGLNGSLYQYPLATDSASYGKLYITSVLIILVFSEANVVICIFLFLYFYSGCPACFYDLSSACQRVHRPFTTIRRPFLTT